MLPCMQPRCSVMLYLSGGNGWVGAGGMHQSAWSVVTGMHGSDSDNWCSCQFAQLVL